MSDLAEAVTEIVGLNGGEVAGKTRLQKMFYLLEATGLGFGIEFDYHKHGPFSAELAFAADDAAAFGYLSAQERPGFHLIPYTVFRVKEAALSAFVEDECAARRRKVLEIMRKYSPVVLELAATAIYLRKHGYPETYWKEVRARKPLKATQQRLDQAEDLIKELKL